MNSPAFISRHRIWAGLVIPVLFAACAPTSDIQQMQDQQFQIRAMVASNQQSIQALDQRLRQLEDQLQEMEHSGDTGGGSHRGNAALARRVAQLEARLNALQGGANPAAPGAGLPPALGGGLPGVPPGATAPANPLVPPSAGTMPPGANPNAAGLTGGAEASTGGNEGTPAGNDEVPPGGGGEASTEPSEAPAAAPVGDWHQDLSHAMAAAHGDDSSAGTLYRSGLDLMQKGQYATAIDRFSQLQKRYPHSDLTEPADYFAAIGYSQLGKQDQAILQFNDLVMRFPKGNYAGSALLREAQAFIRINDKIDARLTLQKLLNEHADSPEASAASALMKNLEAD